MHFTFYLGDSSRIGLNLQFNIDVKSGLSLYPYQPFCSFGLKQLKMLRHFNPIALRKANIAVLEINFFFAGTCSNYLLPSIKVDSKTNIPGSKIGCL